MPIAYITRRERFNAAHRLFRSDLTDEENFNMYGKCSHPNWHGHNFELFVTVKGEVENKIGYVTNLTNISKIIRELVIDKLDHKNLNDIIEKPVVFAPPLRSIAVAPSRDAAGSIVIEQIVPDQ